MSKITKIWAALLLSQQLACWTAWDNNQISSLDSNQEKIEVVASKNVNQVSSELYESLENYTNKIIYQVVPNAKIYKDYWWKEILCHTPNWVVLRQSSIIEEDPNDGFVCVQYKWNKVWIERTSLTDVRWKTMEELEKPTTEKVIKVNKSARKMEVYNQYWKHKVKEFKIAISSRDDWDKTIEWDGNTPVGKYYICAKNPASSFWRNPKTWWRLWSLHVGYPNSQDAFEWLISWDITHSQFNSINNSIKSKWTPSQWTKLWNYIMIHGWWSSSDWTIWCMALDDNDMLRLYNYIGKWTDLYIE